MAFNSLPFIASLVVLVVVYNLLPGWSRPGLLLVASYAFYAYQGVAYLGPLFFITAAAYLGARAIGEGGRRSALVGALAVILLPLLVFKYFPFAVTSFGWRRPTEGWSFLGLAIPAGISFYTFQAVSYLVDVHQGTQQPETRFDKVALYLAWFPTVLSGPIERARKMLPQLANFRPTEFEQAYAGAKYILWGLFCKCVVADNIALVVDRVLAEPVKVSGGSFWVTFALFSFQIYFDLAGYTSVAIGVARMFNVRLSHNFDRPYLAESLRDFWWRWHITASQWFRDYVYVSMGGNRKKTYVRVGQVLSLFLVSGLWHGAAWNFVVWGGLHGVGFATEAEVRRRVARRRLAGSQLPLSRSRMLRVAFTFVFVTSAWVLFRLSGSADIVTAFGRMFWVTLDLPFVSLHEGLARLDTAVAVGLLISALLIDAPSRLRGVLESVPLTAFQLTRDLMFVNWLVVTLVLLGDLGARDFMYFKF